jgi:hypothetical protein
MTPATPRRRPNAESELIEAYRQGLGPRAAARLSPEEIRRDALAAVARVEDEIARMQRAGELKSVNRSYRAYRLEAAARGERVLPYPAWMSRYKADLVREIAAALQ